VWKNVKDDRIGAVRKKSASVILHCKMTEREGTSWEIGWMDIVSDVRAKLNPLLCI
jgi:hypothetical protein